MPSPTPLPGRPVRGSRTGVPLMAALDLIGRHWALAIVWELNERPLGFRDLQQACNGISPAVLSTRLRELREAGVVHADPARRNSLTPLGEDLFLSVGALKAWATLWAEELAKQSGREEPDV